jgi:soluble lytic murein transglycosylase-like protein
MFRRHWILLLAILLSLHIASPRSHFRIGGNLPSVIPAPLTATPAKAGTHHLEFLSTAYQLLESAQFDSAIVVLESNDAGILQSYRDWMLANAYYQSKDYQKAYRVLRRQLMTDHSFPLWSHAYGLSGQCYLRSGEPNRAMQRLARFLNRFPKHPMAAECMLNLARSQLVGTQQYDDALDTYLDVMLVHPATNICHTALSEYILLCDSLGKDPYALGPHRLLGWARIDLTHRRFNHALTLVEKYWSASWQIDDTAADHHGEMAYLQARALEGLGQITSASNHYLDITLQYKGTLWESKSAVALIQLESRRGHFDQAFDYLKNLEELPTNRSYISEAQATFGITLYRAGQHKKAQSVLKNVVKHDNYTPYRQDALWYLGWCEWKQQKYRNAEKWWTALLEDNPGNDYAPAAHYWQARAQRNMGKHDRAREQLSHLAQKYPRNYYGVLARAELQQHPINHPIYLDVPMEVECHLPAFPAASDTSLSAKRYRLLTNLGLLNFAIAEGDSLATQGDYPDWEFHRALLGWQIGLVRPDNGESRLLRFSTMPSDSVAQILYPLDYANHIDKASAEWNIPPGWILSLIRQESAFDTHAQSSDSAMGLLQILPSTAQWLGQRYDLEWDDLFDPLINIQIGTAHFSWLDERFQGAILPILAAFNAGHVPADCWWPPSVNDPAEWIESIPFTETRLFVKRVLANAWTYAQLYPEHELFEHRVSYNFTPN